MQKAQEYFQKIHELLERAEQTQLTAIQQVAEKIAEAYQKGGWLFLFGTGHSHMLAEELFYRAGGMVRVKPILEEGLMLHESASKSTKLERLEGYATILLDDYQLTDKDVLIIISNSGRNGVSVEMALEAKRRGATVIALTNLEHTAKCASRHSSGKRLHELADVVLDNGGCYGDACISFGNRRVAPTSTVIGAMLLNAVECAVLEEMEKKGAACETFSSSNIDGGETVNEGYLQKYRGQIKSL